MQMGTRRVDLSPGEILVVDNLQLHSTVDFPGFDSRVRKLSQRRRGSQSSRIFGSKLF
jgi:hypothetical protein